MGLFDIVGRLAPTIGSVVGQLFGSLSSPNDEPGVVRFDFGSVCPGLGADFVPEGGHIMLHNACSDDKGVLLLDVPARAGLPTQTLALQKYKQFNVTPLFTDCAQNGVDTFGLTACTKDMVSTGANGSSTAVTLSASGCRIIAGKGTQRAGSYLDLSLEGNSLTIKAHDNSMGIVSIPSVTVNGSGDTSAAACGIDGKGMASVTIPLSRSFATDDYVEVDVVCKINNVDKIFVDSNNHPLMSDSTPEQRAMLKRAVVLNK